MIFPGEPSFPSDKHYQQLADKGFEARKGNKQDLWWWHGYDYGWRRIMLQTRDDNSAIDPGRKWFDPGLTAAAEIYYGDKFGKRAPGAPPPLPKASTPRADVEPDPDLALHFRRQDDERISLKRQVQVHGERHPDGLLTPEMEAFMGCCARQIQANEKIYIGRTRSAYRQEARMTQQQIREALGVTTERKAAKHEDPEELRKGREELGLE